MAEQDWDWLRGEVRAESAAFGLQLEAVNDGEARVPNLEWSVSELAAHLVSLPRLYREQNELTDPFERPADFALFSRELRSNITETDPSALAALLGVETESLLEDLGEDPAADRRLYGLATTAGKVAAGFLTELLLHGGDLGRLTGTKVDISHRQANAAIAQMMALAPFFVDPVKAAKCPGVYHLRFRGGDEYTYRIVDGALEVIEGHRGRADCKVVADPVAFLKVALGRMSQTKAGLLGKIIGYGRKPWLLLPLGRIQVDGI